MTEQRHPHIVMLLTELKQARNYVAVIAKRTTEPKVHADLATIDAAIAEAEQDGP